ncbi:MAG: hypothetical protein AAGA90_24110 [Actinomycetota bacterium]
MTATTPDETTVSNTEIAELLDVQLNTVQTWGKNRLMPPSAGRHGHIPFWMRSTIIAWAGDIGKIDPDEQPDLALEYEDITGRELVPFRVGGPMPAEVKERLRNIWGIVPGGSS